MVLSLSWKFIFCFVSQLLINNLHGIPLPSKGDLDEFIEHFLKVQNFKTGYAVFDPYNRPFLPNSTREGTLFIETITRKKFNDLQCGYLYGAQLHLHLTKELFSKNNWTVLTSNTLQDFLFVNEATFMIDSLFLEIPEDMNEILLLYAYAVKTSKFFRIIVNNKTTLRGNTLVQNKFMHEYVANEIAHVLKNCRFYNDFNMNSQSNQRYERIKSIKNIKEDTATVLDVIRENKTLLRDMFNHNVANGLVSSIDSTFSDSVLYFHGIDNFWLFVENFLIQNDDSTFFSTAWPAIQDMYIKTKDCGLEGMRGLQLYQHMVLETMKILILRITIAYVRLIDKMMDTNEHIAKQYARIYSNDILKIFMNDFWLHDDSFFVNFYEHFNEVYLSGTNAKKNEIIDTIRQRLERISYSLNFPCTSPILSDKSIDDVLAMAKSFISTVYDSIGNRTTIKLIKSFSTLVIEYPGSISGITTDSEENEKTKKEKKRSTQKSDIFV